MNRLCEIYIRHAKLIGAFYCWVPTVAWFTAIMSVVPLREVYLLRLAIAFFVGGYVAARMNDYGVHLWLIKHRSKDGPATVADGILIGAGVGIGITLLPPLSSMIGTRHPEEAKLFIIIAWAAGIVLGGLIGGVLSSIGRKYLDLDATVKEESQK